MFVGGNHEASNFLGSLFYGGWVAPKHLLYGGGRLYKRGRVAARGRVGIWHKRHQLNPGVTSGAGYVRGCDPIGLPRASVDVFPPRVAG